jgi:hypothetical protein
MSTILKAYGDTLGPLGFPMKDRQARNLDALLKALPREKEYEYRRAVITKAPTELNPGERSDVSWITTATPDCQGHVVLPRGMNDSQFVQNPIVTVNHCYAEPPIGRSLWRKHVKDGELQGIKAKTHYPPRPDDWAAADWPPDRVFALIQSGLLQAKSIGFLPTKLHFPTEAESRRSGWQDVSLIIDEWVLLEYAVGTIPINPDCVVESIHKTQDREASIPFLALDQIEAHVQQCLGACDFNAIARQVIEDRIDLLRGRV